MYKKTEPGGDNEDMYHYRGVVNSYLGMMLVPKIDIDKINELIGRK
jgi:hypothetical protein